MVAALLADTLPLPVAAVGPELRVLWCNAAFTRSCARLLAAEVGPGTPLRVALGHRPNELQTVIDCWQRAMAGERFTVHRQLGDPKQELIPVELQYAPLRDAEGTLLGATVQLVELAVEGRAADEERLRLALQATSDGVWDWSRDTGELAVSDAAWRLLGHAPLPATLTTIAGLIHDEDLPLVWSALMEHLRGDTETFRCECRMRSADGDWRWILHRGKAMRRGPDGRAMRVVGTCEDVTLARDAEHERNRLLGELDQARRLEATGRLAGGVAHDFNNILTAIIGIVECLGDERPDDSELRRDLDEIRAGADRAARLTRHLLAYGRQQLLALVPLDLLESLRVMRPSLERLCGPGHQLVVAGGPEVGVVRADPLQLEQVLVALVANARDAMPAGGTIRIQLQRRDVESADALALGVERPGRFAEVIVSDTGHGMDEHVRARLFEPFFTTKAEGQGAGLGLAMVYGVVRQLGGTVSVASARDRGTSVSVLLPLVVAEPVARARPTAAPSAAGVAPGRVLLVEEDEQVREATRRLLGRWGWEVLEATGGPEAIALLEQHGADVHFVITDVTMTHMAGTDLAAILRSRRPSLPILLMSGFPGDADAGRTLHGFPLLQKPFTPGDLRREMDLLLAATPADDA